MGNIATNSATDVIGLRELRAGLSSFVARVKAGHTLTLTEHGRPIARLAPWEGQSTYERLMVEGVITPARRSGVVPVVPVEAIGSISGLIAEQRR
jgi:prevent-host-death family protein